MLLQQQRLISNNVVVRLAGVSGLLIGRGRSCGRQTAVESKYNVFNCEERQRTVNTEYVVFTQYRVRHTRILQLATRAFARGLESFPRPSTYMHQ